MERHAEKITELSPVVTTVHHTLNQKQSFWPIQSIHACTRSVGLQSCTVLGRLESDCPNLLCNMCEKIRSKEMALRMNRGWTKGRNFFSHFPFSYDGEWTEFVLLYIPSPKVLFLLRLHCFKLQGASLPEINRISKNKGDGLLSRITDLEPQTRPNEKADLNPSRSYKIQWIKWISPRIGCFLKASVLIHPSGKD
jgi:hypothetical protein